MIKKRKVHLYKCTFFNMHGTGYILLFNCSKEENKWKCH
jgi:hypothetical protein